jgi:hypothetical protein
MDTLPVEYPATKYSPEYNSAKQVAAHPGSGL